MSDHTGTAEYVGIAKAMADDQARTEREREIERAYGQDLPQLLEALTRKHDSMAAVLRDLNDTDRLDSRVSKPTLYGWCEKYGIRD